MKFQPMIDSKDFLNLGCIKTCHLRYISAPCWNMVVKPCGSSYLKAMKDSQTATATGNGKGGF